MAGKRKPITFEQVVEAMKIVVDKQGAAYKYPQDERGTCHYVRDGRWSCLVGKVLGQLRVTTVKSFDAMYENQSARNLLPKMEEAEGIKFTPEATDALTEAQSYQDRGYSWGESLVKAIATKDATDAWLNRRTLNGQQSAGFFDV